ISVCLSGGNAYPFFPVSMHDVANQVINLRDVWGPRADELQDRVDTAETTRQRIHLIQQFLIAQLHQFGKPDFGVRFGIEKIRQSNGKLSLEELAADIGISNRQLVRRFNQYVGLSPKEFARMTTFLHALKHLKNYPALSLTEIAYKSDYYDQAHFIRACRDFSGLTPGELTGTDNVLY
ncbi:helix-turn-helix domain-containing protein, partial [Spirosoma sp.]|uniref:AraC family transcriptional regulator n=1 Tax=Spirosoma sp. TaxID=1899569 RepID=UPI003B3A7E39